jgi:hypothetical protein
MINLKAIASVAAVAFATAAVPAQAVVTTFATFAPLSADAQSSTYSNIRWANISGFSGTSGTIDSVTSNSSSPSAGARAVSFSFLVSGLSPLVNNATAIYTWSAATPAVELAIRTGSEPGSTLTQGGISGTFSFLSTSVITVGDTVYASGSNLLSGTFTNSVITGQQFGSTASYDADSSVMGQSLTFSSDFIDFSGVSTSVFALDLENLRSVLSALPTNLAPTTALRTFRASASGEFGVDGDLVVNGIPEPQTWGLMVVGFGMVGLQVRRRNRRTAVAA